MRSLIIGTLLTVVFLPTFAETLNVPLSMLGKNDAESAIGSVQFSDTPYGLLITPQLHGLTAGVHGFHVHEHPSCDQDGMAAGGHLDPQHTNQHLGPYTANGHLGDLPALTVEANGNATLPILAPRLKVDMIKNHSLMIHAGGDNYSDLPEKMGGGGQRIACGVIK